MTGHKGLTVVQGDLFRGGETIVAHGCNALGKFHRGFAKEVADRHPGSFAVYLEEAAGPGLRLGTVLTWNGPSVTVLHCVTQPTYGREGVHVSYDALTACMREIEFMAANRIGSFARTRRVAMPRIGADRGGGDWDRIARIITDELREAQPVVYELPGRVRGGR